MFKGTKTQQLCGARGHKSATVGQLAIATPNCVYCGYALHRKDRASVDIMTRASVAACAVFLTGASVYAGSWLAGVAL